MREQALREFVSDESVYELCMSLYADPMRIQDVRDFMCMSTACTKCSVSLCAYTSFGGFHVLVECVISYVC